MQKREKKERIWNIPNIFSLSRIIITFVVVYLVAINAKIEYIVIIFAIGMITDFIDGKLARDLNQRTEIGRNLDIIADRIFLVTIMIVVLLEFSMKGLLDSSSIFQIIAVMSREIITFPFALLLVLSGKKTPEVRYIGKVVTFMQGVTVPIIFLSIFYNAFAFSIYLAIATGITGIVSALLFANDVLKGLGGKKK